MTFLMLLSITVAAYVVFYELLIKFLRPYLIREERLESVRNLGRNREKEERKAIKKKKDSKYRFIKVSAELQEEIRLSGIQMKPEEFMVLWFFGVLFPAALCFTFTVNFINTIAVALIGAIVPPLIVKKKLKDRRKIFQQQLGDALLIISNGLRSGYSFVQALDSVADAMTDPIAGEFKTASREIQLGMDTEESLLGIAERMQSEDFKLLTTAVVVQQKVGGNLSEIMETIAETIRERFRIERSVKTLTAQGRISGLIIGCLPVVICLAIALVNPEYIEPMFTTLRGQILIGLGVLMELLGILLIRKIVDIKL